MWMHVFYTCGANPTEGILKAPTTNLKTYSSLERKWNRSIIRKSDTADKFNKCKTQETPTQTSDLTTFLRCNVFWSSGQQTQCTEAKNLSKYSPMVHSKRFRSFSPREQWIQKKASSVQTRQESHLRQHLRSVGQLAGPKAKQNRFPAHWKL